MIRYPISRFLNVRNAYFPAFSSDGKRVAFLTDITGVAQVWQVDLAGTDDLIPWPDQLTFETDRVMGVWYTPLPGDSRLLYSSDVGGNENAQLFLLDTQTGEEVPLTAGHDAAMHTFGDWLPSGEGIVFAANRRDPGLFDLYVQPFGGEARLVWQNDKPGFLFDISVSPDGTHAIVTRMASSFDHALFEVDLQSGKARTLSAAGAPARYEIARYASDGKSLYVLTDLNSDVLYIGKMDPQTLAVEPLVTSEWDIDLMELSPDCRWLAYTVNVDGASSLQLCSVETGAKRTVGLPTGTPGVVGMLDIRLTFSPASDLLGFSFTSADRPSDVFTCDLQSNEVRAITRSGQGGLPSEVFASPELIHYPTFDADEHGNPRQIPAWFYRPAGQPEGERLPVVVIVHGGPEAQLRPYFNFLAQYLQNSGYAVLAPNVRGSAGYGKAYSHLDDVEKRMDSVADLANAARWLKAQPGIDGDRLVVYGGSYGGFMVLSSLTTYPELWAAGVDLVGISNFVTFLENTSDYRRAHREAEYGSLERDRDFLASISPLNHSDKIQAPLMVIHGANDPRVPLSEAEQLVQALRSRGVPVQFLVFPDEGHGVVKLKNKLVAYPAVVEFLSRVLGVSPPGD